MKAEVRQKVEETVAAYPAIWDHGICAYDAFSTDKGTNFGRGSRTGDVCHAGLNYIREPHIVINAHRPDWFKTNPEFFKWIMLESPFAHGILNKDDQKEWTNHASVMDTELIGKGGALWLCKAIRHFVEDAHKPAIWDKLRNEGLTGLQAFIGSDIINMAGEPMTTNSHVSLFRYSDPSTLRKWYNEALKRKKIEDADANKGDYALYNGPTWGTLGFKVEKKKDGWGGFIEKRVPADPKDFAKSLKEIFEGDPKNVG